MTQEPLKKILYVEDDPAIAEVAKMTLEMLGHYEVLHCDCGQKALESFNEYKPQLILIDMMMPEMDGIETIKNIKALEGGDKPVVIFMTAKAQIHEQQSYIESGASGVITKPFDPNHLCSEIEDIWRK